MTNFHVHRYAIRKCLRCRKQYLSNPETDLYHTTCKLVYLASWNIKDNDKNLYKG